MMTSALVTLLADIAALNTVAMDQLVELRAGALIGYELLLFFIHILFVYIIFRFIFRFLYFYFCSYICFYFSRYELSFSFPSYYFFKLFNRVWAFYIFLIAYYYSFWGIRGVAAAPLLSFLFLCVFVQTCAGEIVAKTFDPWHTDGSREDDQMSHQW